jgi:hypothetical protein
LLKILPETLFFGRFIMRPISFLILLSVFTGCAVHTSTEPQPPPTSTTLATNAMWPSMSAQSDGQTLKVYAALLKGSDFVLLDGGEYFTATVGAQSVIMSQEPYTDGKIHYLATFAAPAVAADVVIDFHRAGGRIEAGMSRTAVAPVFTISSAAPPSVARGAVLDIAIAPSPVTKGDPTDRMTLAFSGTCVDNDSPHQVTFDANGHTTFDTSLVPLVKNTHGCDLSVQVRHETLGQSDPAFQNGGQNNVEGLQARSFNTAITL